MPSSKFTRNWGGGACGMWSRLDWTLAWVDPAQHWCTHLSQPNQPSPQASPCQTASALNGPKLGRFSRQPGRLGSPSKNSFTSFRTWILQTHLKTIIDRNKKKRLVFKFFVQGQNYSRYLICCWYLRHKKCGREIFILFVTKHIFVIQIRFGIILTKPSLKIESVNKAFFVLILTTA